VSNAGARRAPAALLVVAGAAAQAAVPVDEPPTVAAPASQLQARVAAVRAAWAAEGETPGGFDAVSQQVPNWTNWPKWSKWSNWANK
jgi:hypothetical protein